MKQFFIILLAMVLFAPVQATAQCKFLTNSELLHLAAVGTKEKAQWLNSKGAVVLTRQKIDPNCQFRTYVRCKTFINDEKWHWAEIVTFNSCDSIITYSTSDKDQFNGLVRTLGGREMRMTTQRSYDGLEFTLYEGKQLAFETNVHSNEEGMEFYLINVLRVP